MSPHAGGSKGGGDNLIPIIILVAVVSMGAWTAFRAPVIRGAVLLMQAEAAAVAPVVELVGSAGQQSALAAWRRRLQSVHGIVPLNALAAGLREGGTWIRIPAAFTLLILAAWVYRRSPVTRYARTLNFEGLLAEQQLSFPRVRPVMWLRGRLYDRDRGAYTWSLSPYEWAMRHGVIKASKDPETTRATYADDKAITALAAQLGQRYQGTERMAYHKQLLSAAFIARALDQRAASDDILDAIAAGFQPVGWSRGMSAIWRRWRGRKWDWPANGPYEIALTPAMQQQVDSYLIKATDERIATAAQQHWHENSVMIAWLSLARARQGTLASSDYIWLKAIDRPLHYALNDVGRRVACAEAAGIRAHIQHEAANGRTETPHVARAVDALRTHLDECGWQPPPAVSPDQLANATGTVAGGGPGLHPHHAPTPTATTGDGQSGGGGIGLSSGPSHKDRDRP